MANNVQTVQVDPSDFLYLSRPKTTQYNNVAVTGNSEKSHWELNRVGYLATLYLLIQCTVTITGTVSAGTFQNWARTGSPAPLNLIKRITFGSTGGQQLINLSGNGLYMHLRDRYGIDPMNSNASANDWFGKDMVTNLGLSNTGRINYGANIAAGTYTFNLALPIPIAYNRRGEFGLIVLQTTDVTYALDVEWGQWSGATAQNVAMTNDLVNGLTFSNVGGGSVAVSCNASIGSDWFTPVKEVDPGRMTSMFKSLLEFPQTLQAGENTVKMPSTEWYTMVSMQVVNNGLPVPCFVAGAPQIGRVQWTHSANQTDSSDDYLMRAARNFWEHESVPSDGSLCFDFGLRNGQRQWRDILDAFNDQEVTELAVKFQYNGNPTGWANILTVHESLKAVTQS